MNDINAMMIKAILDKAIRNSGLVDVESTSLTCDDESVCMEEAKPIVYIIKVKKDDIIY